MAFAWGGLPRHKFPLTYIFVALAPLLAFPLFVLASASIRWASFCLWTLGPAYSLAMFQISADSFVGSFLHYLGLLLACIFDRMAVMLWVTAWLVLFGTRIYATQNGEKPAATIGS
jgi:hypothetical protein